jgi:hypothetical protein
MLDQRENKFAIEVKVEIPLRLTVGQHVLVSSTLVRLATRCYFLSKVEVTLRLTVCLGIEYPCGTCDQILLPVGMLLSEICGLISTEHPLWREHWSAICSVITQWSESLRTRNHTLLSHLRLPQPGGPVRVRVTLRLTVCQSVRLSVEPTLGLTTRFFFL